MPVKKTQKIEAQVVQAIRRLQAVQGSTPREISSYISQEYDLPRLEIKRQIQIALKRGVTYGILQRMNGDRYTYNQEFLETHPISCGDTPVMIPCHGRRGRRKRSRSRRKSSKRRRGGRSHRRSRSKRRDRQMKKAEELKEIDGSEVKTLAKQPKGSSSSLLRKESLQSDVSSISEEKHE